MNNDYTCILVVLALLLIMITTKTSEGYISQRDRGTEADVSRSSAEETPER